MRKQIKKLATSNAIILTSDEMKLNNLAIGDILEVNFTKVTSEI